MIFEEPECRVAQERPRPELRLLQQERLGLRFRKVFLCPSHDLANALQTQVHVRAPAEHALHGDATTEVLRIRSTQR